MGQTDNLFANQANADQATNANVNNPANDNQANNSSGLFQTVLSKLDSVATYLLSISKDGNNNNPNAKPPKEPEVSSPEQKQSSDDIFKLKEKIFELEKENKQYREDIELRKIAQDNLAKKELEEKINKQIELLVEKRVIASEDVNKIKIWKELYNANFENAELLAREQIEMRKDAGKENKSGDLSQKLSEEAHYGKAMQDINHYFKTGEWAN